MDQLSDYTIIQPLKAGVTTLVVDPVGRRLVFKLLPSDCLWQGHLHPNVRDRFERLREIPATQFHGLIGVEVSSTGIYTMSPYIEGVNLRDCDPDRQQLALKQLPRIVSSLHRLGMVHGDIGPGNVIVDRTGKAHLIDPSPLLHDDFEVDLLALRKLGCEIDSSAETNNRADNGKRSIRYQSLISAVILVLVAFGVAWMIRVYFVQ